MTSLTTLGRQNVLSIFARGGIAVMTAGAIAVDVAVIKSRRQPCGGLMASIALSRGRDVVGVFAHGDVAVVTA